MIQYTPGVTELLATWRDGDEESGHLVIGMVYEELRRLARGYFRHEATNHTLQPTALVHEVCMRLMRDRPDACGSREHLIGLAARAMRQVLVNYALRRKTLKRGGDRQRITFDPTLAVFEDRCLDLLALDDALQRLAVFDERMSRIVELRFFGGLSVEQTARMLDTSHRTIERDWAVARAWLRREVAPK